MYVCMYVCMCVCVCMSVRVCKVCKSETTKSRAERDLFIPIVSTNKLFHLMRVLSCPGFIIGLVKTRRPLSRPPSTSSNRRLFRSCRSHNDSCQIATGSHGLCSDQSLQHRRLAGLVKWVITWISRNCSLAFPMRKSTPNQIEMQVSVGCQYIVCRLVYVRG